MPYSADDMRLLAESAAEKAAEKTITALFTKLGVDIENPLDMQRDFQHLRDWRVGVESVKSKGVGAAIVVVVTGILGFLWSVVGFKIPGH